MALMMKMVRYLPEEQGEGSGASRPDASRLGVRGHGRGGGGSARGGGEQELSGDRTGGVARMNWDQRDGAVVVCA